MSKNNRTGKDYKAIIINRLKTTKQPLDSKKNSYSHSLKTQCTPNERAEENCESFFQDMDAYCRVQYQPVQLRQQRKSIKRSLYPELIALQKMGQQDQSRMPIPKNPDTLRPFSLNAAKEQKTASYLKNTSGKLQRQSKYTSSPYLTRSQSLVRLKESRTGSLVKVGSKKQLLKTRTKRVDTEKGRSSVYVAEYIRQLLRKK